MKFLLSLLVVSLVFILPTYSKTKGVPIIIKGTVTDQFTGKPLDVTLQFRDEEGTRFRIKPNIIDGSYSQVVTSGMSYEVTFINYDVLRETQTLNIPFTDTYEEKEVDFQAKKLSPGLDLFKKKFFTGNDAKLSNDASEFLKEFQTIMRFNRGGTFKFIVLADDSNPKNIQNANEIAKKRLEELKNYLSSWKSFYNRLDFEILNSSKKSAGEHNVIIQVIDIKDPLE